MPHEDVRPAIYAAVKALLAAHAPLVALIGTKPIAPGGPAIYDDGAVPQAATSTDGWRPYLTIGAGTQVPRHTIGPHGSAKYGWNCTFQVKAIGQISEASGGAIVTQIAAVLYDGRDLNLAGYESSWTEEFTSHPTIITTVAGVTTREWPVIVRAQCHD